MTIRMNNLEQLTLDEMEEFVTSHRHLNWSATGQKSVYGLIEGLLKAERYGHLNKGQKGVVKGFLAKVTALSRAQITRLMQRWIQTKRIERQPGSQPTFPRRYTATDVALLAGHAHLARRLCHAAPHPVRQHSGRDNRQCHRGRPRLRDHRVRHEPHGRRHEQPQSPRIRPHPV